MSRPAPTDQAHSLSSQAYLQLEAMIVGQQLPPGALITEGQLIERLNLGRTPVREAMQRLAWEGLIEVRPRAGIKVTDLRPADFVKVLNLRVLLEPQLVAAAVRNATPKSRGQLAPVRYAMVGAERENDLGAFMRSDKHFDSYLMDAADDVFLRQTLAPLQTHSRRFWYRFVARSSLKETVRLHLPVIDACLAGNETAAVSAMQALLAGMLATADGVLQKSA